MSLCRINARSHTQFTISKPYALALCMLSMFCVFLVELLALRWGTARLRKLGLVQGMSIVWSYRLSIEWYSDYGSSHSN